MEWTNELILEFINIYEKYPIIWNPKHPGHKNRNNLHDAWQNIAKEISIDVSVDILKKKKESLMATYRTLAKKVRDSEITGSGATDLYLPSWFAYAAIDRFIKATVTKKPSLCSEETHNDSELDSIFDQNEINNEENNETNTREERQHFQEHESLKDENVNISLPQSHQVNKKRGAHGTVESNITKHLKKASDALTTLTSTKPQTQLQDAPALYGQLLAAKLRKLSRRTQLILQNKIDNLVFEAELNEINDCNFISPQYYAYVSSPSPSSNQSANINYASSPAPSNATPENTNLTSQESDPSIVFLDAMKTIM